MPSKFAYLFALAMLICGVSVGQEEKCQKEATIKVADRDVIFTQQDAEQIKWVVEKYLAEKKPKLEPEVTGPGPAIVDCWGTIRMGRWILGSAFSDKQELKLSYRIRQNDLILMQQVIDLEQVAGEWQVTDVGIETFHALR